MSEQYNILYLQVAAGVTGEPDVTAVWLLGDEELEQARELLEATFGVPVCTLMLAEIDQEFKKHALAHTMVHSDIEGFEEMFAEQAKKM